MEWNLISPRVKKSVVEQVLFNRGINNAYRYLNVTNEEVYDPLLLDNMREGAALLVKHISQKNKVFVQIDEDCDGYTSAAVLINYLNLVAPYFVQHYLVYKTHDKKEHGIVIEVVPPDTKLVIIPDAGSSQLLEHSLLANAGMDVLILDHHNAQQYTPNACLINNQTCNYPNKGLSGVGIVYKFCCYLDSLLGVDYAQRFLDLVAVGLNNIGLIYLFH